MPQTLMILGAGIFQMPLILKAKEIGLRTVVCSYLADDPGMRIADKAYNVSTLNKKAVLKTAKQEKIDGVITIASEAAMPTCSYVANKLGLPGHDYKITKTILNKFLLRSHLKSHGLKVPQFGKAKTVNEALRVFKKIGKKAIMKPLEASGSRGLIVLESKEDLIKNFEASKKFSFGEKGIIIEEFMEGIEVGGESLIYNGKLVFFQITNKYLNKYYVPTGHSLPSKLNSTTQQQIEDLINKCINASNLDLGALNFDVMVTDKGPVVIELGARLGGNCLPILMKMHTNVDTIKQAILISLGKKPKISITSSKESHCVAILGAKRSGILKTIANINQLKNNYFNIIEIQYDYPLGHKVKEFTQGAYRVGHIIFKEKDINSAERFFNNLDNILNMQIN